jgi:hypothetical protein
MTEAIKFNIAAKVQQYTHFEDELVCEGVDAVYFLEKGKLVEYFYCGDDKFPMRIMTPVSVMRMYEFFTGVSSNKVYRSKRYTEMLSLDRRDCLSEFNNALREQFFMIKEGILFQENLAIIRIECDVCKGKHMENECPKLHYVASKFRNFKEGWWNKRSTYLRRKARSSKLIDYGMKGRSEFPFADLATNYTVYKWKFNIDFIAQTKIKNMK